MKRKMYFTAVFAAGAILSIGTMASAEDKTPPKSTTSKSTTPPAATAAQSSGNHHGQAPGMAVDHAGGNGVRHMAGSGTGAQDQKTVEKTDHPSKGNASQAPGIAVDHAGGNTQKAKSNGGENPLYEPKDKTAAKNKPTGKTGAGSSTVEYKDPEDMTTRYRPGNNKTKATAGSSVVEYKDPEDMTTRNSSANDKTKAAANKTKQGSAPTSH